METPRNRIEHLFSSSEIPFSAERLYSTKEKDMLKNVDLYEIDFQEEESDVISGYFELILNSLVSSMTREQESSREEIELLRKRLEEVEKKLNNINELVKMEYELDAKLQSEIEEMESIKIDPLKLDPKEWAPSIEDLKEYLDDE